MERLRIPALTAKRNKPLVFSIFSKIPGPVYCSDHRHGCSFNTGSFLQICAVQTRGIAHIVIHQFYCRNVKPPKPSGLRTEAGTAAVAKIHAHVMGWTRWKLSMVNRLFGLIYKLKQGQKLVIRLRRV